MRGWDPKLWASWKPFGLGEQRPNNYLEIARAVWENRQALGYAWRILTQGVCDGCALGTSGLRDWTLPGVHLCNVRLRLLRLNTLPPLNPAWLANVARWSGVLPETLRGLGRLSHPMVWRKGEAGFQRVSWDEALELVASRLRGTEPTRVAFYLTSRGLANEHYYAAQKAARALGTNNIDNAARVCHAPSTLVLKETLGVGATTCSYTDLLGTDLAVFAGSHVANNQPVMMKYLYYARRQGTRVVCVNPYREPGMERYWVPSVLESALFGTRITDRFYRVRVGGDAAFFNGTLRWMVERGWVDRHFIETHTVGFPELVRALEAQSWEELERQSGCSREEMLEFAQMVAQARTAVFVWSMGVTQHACGEDNVRALVNLALSRGFVGRDKCGLMPIRGHSGVQGGAEMGAYATVFPGGVPVNEQNAQHFSDLWGFPVPDRPGLTAPEMVDAAHAGRLEVLVCAGGNFLEVLPDPDYVREALERVPVRVHLDIVLSPAALVPAQEFVVLLPATTRYEVPGGVTQTTTERRVVFSPEIPGPRVAEARPEWEVLLELAPGARPELADRLYFRNTAAIREEIARAVPFYNGIQHLRCAGDQFQYGGPRLCEGWRFPTPDGRARFSVVIPKAAEVPEGAFLLTTRRGRQFNSMVQGPQDALTGGQRDSVFMSPPDASRLGLREGQTVLLRSAAGTFRGRVRLAPLRPGTLQVYWPEGNVLLSRDRRSPESRIPDYNAVVWVESVPSSR